VIFLEHIADDHDFAAQRAGESVDGTFAASGAACGRCWSRQAVMINVGWVDRGMP
jgi:hypothetical protein